MKKVIVIVLWFLLVSLDSNRTQKNSVSSEGEKFAHNEVKAINISVNVNIKHNHPFAKFCKENQEIAIYYQLECGIPTSIQLAQAIVESGGGKSRMALMTNNLFGMKYYKALYDGDYWTSASGVRWRKYDSIEDSFRDHAEFLHKFYPKMIGKNWKFWINNCTGYGAGQYWKHIGSVIERYELWRYDDLVDKHQNNQKSRTYNL
jgi:flagellum-specific peptidoglycan hydrolase FlgJ